jgi:hypothetical protein
MMGFLSKLNVASWGLAVGAGGQAGIYNNLFPEMPTWAILVPVVLPWLTVYTISFCRVLPFAPRPFRNCLLFAICWYTAMTAVAETSLFIIRPTQVHFPVIAARILGYSGALSFIVLIPAYMSLRRTGSI